MLTQCQNPVRFVEAGPEPPFGPSPSPSPRPRTLKRRRPTRARLPWFRCRKCGNRLAMMDIVNGRTCVRVSAYAVSYKITLTCEFCGEDREFISMDYR